MLLKLNYNSTILHFLGSGALTINNFTERASQGLVKDSPTLTLMLGSGVFS